MSTNIKTEQEMINELKEINELKDILALFGIDVQEEPVKKKEEPAKKPVQKSETENIYSKAYEAGFNAGIKEGFEKATKTTKNTVEASTAAVRDEMQKKIDVWKAQAEHYHMMAVSAYAFMGTLMKAEPEQLRTIYNMTGNKTEIITKVVDTLSFSEAKKLYDEYIDKCLKPGSMVTDKDGKTAVVITIYSKMSPHYGTATIMYPSGMVTQYANVDELTSEGRELPEVRALFDALQNS